MTYKIIHFRDNCIGCGACYSACEKYWKMNEEDGLADLIEAEKVDNDFILELDIDLEINKEAAESCPVNCIKIEE